MIINQENNSLIKRDNKNSDNSPRDVPQISQSKESLSVYTLTIYESIWRGIFLIVIFAGIFLASKVYEFHNDPRLFNIPKGSIYDFWVSCVSAIAIGTLRFLIKAIFKDKVINILSDKRRKNPVDAMKRADQICKWIFDFFYYLSTTIVAYLIIKDQPFLPPSLFGSGSCDNMFVDYPRVAEIPYLRIFYLVQSGTHLYTFLHQIFAKFSDPKFYEYALHHGCALFLLWFSYMMNFLNVGVIVLFLHDPGDVTLIASRFYTDFKYRNVVINIFIYIITYITWTYTRNIMFPMCAIKSSVEHFLKYKDVDPLFDTYYYPIIYMIGMMAALVLMHFYWTYFLTKAAIQMLFNKGKDKNGYDS